MNAQLCVRGGLSLKARMVPHKRATVSCATLQTLTVSGTFGLRFRWPGLGFFDELEAPFDHI